MSIRRTLVLAAALAATTAAAPAHAAPGDYTITYNWSTANDGFTGWGTYEVPDVTTPGYQNPFYAVRLGLPKLRIQTTPAADGTTDRVYPAVESPIFGPRRLTLVQAPGTTTIRSATFDHIDTRRASNERQFLRVAVYGQGPPAPDNTFDFLPPDYQNDVTYTDVGPITVDPAQPGGSAQVWIATSCDPSCPTVGFDAGGAPRSWGQVGTIRIDLTDPENPSINAAGDLADGAWTNARDTRAAAITATDPGSGIRNVRAVRRRTGGAAVQVLNADAPCDRHHTGPGQAGRDAAPCPDHLNPSLAQSLGGLPDGEYTYTVTATDDSDRTQTTTFPVRLDRTPPSTVTGTGPLRSLLGRWTNRGDSVSLLVRGRDTRAGIRRVELVAQLGGGVERVVAGSDAPCASACPLSFADRLNANLKDLPDGRVGLSVRAYDGAGNVTARRVGTLLLDRVAPTPPIFTVSTAASSTVLSITPGTDPLPGSGVVGYVGTYRPTANASLRSFKLAAEGQLRGRGSRARIASRTEGEVQLRSVDRAGNQSAAFAAGYGTQSCREELVGKPFVRTAKIGEVRAGSDTTGILTYGEDGTKSLELAGSVPIKGVSIGFSEKYEHSRGVEMRKFAQAGEGFNVAVKLDVQEWKERKYINGKKTKGFCPITAPPTKHAYRVLQTNTVPLSAKPMPSWQLKRADCNNAARWGGHRIRVNSGAGYTKSQNNRISFSSGLSVLGVGFTTANTWTKSSSITYNWGTKYKLYLMCGDGGTLDPATHEPDAKTWMNLFVAGWREKGRAK
jgi:hypothetical protein